MSGQVRWFMSLIILVVLTVACSNQEQAQTGEMPEMIKVELMVQDKASLHKPVSLKVKLMQGGKPLIHADHVQFQIWNNLEDPPEVSPELGMMTAEKLEEQGALKASETDEGIYQVEYTFEEPGTYVVQAHVTHGAMHSMPRATVEAK